MAIAIDSRRETEIGTGAVRRMADVSKGGQPRLDEDPTGRVTRRDIGRILLPRWANPENKEKAGRNVPATPVPLALRSTVIITEADVFSVKRKNRPR